MNLSNIEITALMSFMIPLCVTAGISFCVLGLEDVGLIYHCATRMSCILLSPSDAVLCQ